MLECLFQELLGLLYEAEVAVARLESLRKKFGAGQEAADKLAASPGYIAQRRSHSSGTARLADTKKQAANQVDDFVLELVDNTEVEVSGAGGGPIGRTITQLFCESQKVSLRITAWKSAAALFSFTTLAEEKLLRAFRCLPHKGEPAQF